jgi:hypothetical protein
VPKLDFLVVGDHVRPDSGVFNILAAGVDRIFTEVPGAVFLGLAGRVTFDREEASNRHVADVRITGPDGKTVLQVRGEMAATLAPDVPEDWPIQTGLGLNLLVPFQEHGVHTLSLVVDGEELKVIPLIVGPPQEA